jgi:hypothetical protein
MPYSSPKYKLKIREFFSKKVGSSSKILDVGPGMGQYGYLLQDLGYTIDCVEIFEPYIDKFKLHDKYDNVYGGDIKSFDFSTYDVLILGDILEHLKIKEAKKLLKEINEQNKKCLVCVPYEMEQGEVYGNIYEKHHQSDLTPDVMKKRYPELKFLIGDDEHGYYIN